ncbi:hypothetical protein [Eubacterium sp.]|uniref:hypothetical protein n=1 Tax=Eubacterium sp. TaxID=142586 RepID=UPI003521BA4D
MSERKESNLNLSVYSVIVTSDAPIDCIFESIILYPAMVKPSKAPITWANEEYIYRI